MTSAMRLSNVMPDVVNIGRCKRVARIQIGVGQDRKRQMQPLRRLALIAGVLRRKAKNVGDAERFEFGKMIAKAARLRRAAARAGISSQPGGASTPGTPVRG